MSTPVFFPVTYTHSVAIVASALCTIDFINMHFIPFPSENGCILSKPWCILAASLKTSSPSKSPSSSTYLYIGIGAAAVIALIAAAVIVSRKRKQT